MSNDTRNAEKILATIKGLRSHLQADEEPIQAEPAIWDAGQDTHSEICDVIVTNQRLLGYYFRSFPRERLFLDTLNLSDITNVTLRQKTHSPIFRELLVAAGPRKVYIRTPRQKSEALYAVLRSTIERYVPTTTPTYDTEPESEASPTPVTPSQPAPVYGRQDIRVPFDNSPLAITILFVGGIVLEIIAALLWALTHSSQVGLPLFFAGLLAVIVATLVRRQRH